MIISPEIAVIYDSIPSLQHVSRMAGTLEVFDRLVMPETLAGTSAMLGVLFARDFEIEELDIGDTSVDFARGRYNFITYGTNNQIITPNLVIPTAIPEVAIPETVRISEVHDIEDLPGGTVLLKDEAGVGGENKIPFTSDQDKEKLFGWIQDRGPELAGRAFVVQQFIEAPGEAFTSYRLNVMSDGQLLSASLLHSGLEQTPLTLSDLTDPELAPFVDPDSSRYVAPQKVVSNFHSGGTGVMLSIPGHEANSSKLSGNSRGVIESHGIDPSSLEAPQILVEAGKKIGEYMGPSRALLLGVDLIQSAEDGKLYYLEANPYPGLQPLYERFGINENDPNRIQGLYMRLGRLFGAQD